MKAAIGNDNLASRRFLLSQPVIEINSLTNDKRSCLHFPEPWYIDYQILDPESSLYDLLDAGCDINIVSDDGKLPIDSYEDKEMCFEVMKNTNGIMAGFSLFDILHRSYHKLALRIEDGDEDKFDDKMAAKFPLYAGMIKYRLEKAGQRRKLFNQVEDILYKVFSRYLPATFIHEMFFYFSNFELSKLVEIKKKIKDLNIFRNLCYEEVREKIMSKELSVNTVVKISEKDRIKTPHLEFLPDTAEDFCQYTILHLAIYVDDNNLVDFLLENNADMKLGTENLGPVILSAIGLRRLKYVKKLVTAGADVNQIIYVYHTHEVNYDRFNIENNSPRFFHSEYTPLEFAVQLKANEIARFLISQGADVHVRIGNDEEKSDSPMGIAAFTNNVKMLKLLMKHGADINAGDDNGLTPLMKATIDNYTLESRRFLLSQPSIEIDSLTNDKQSCLHFPGNWFIDADADEPESSLQDLLDAGCDVNIVSDHGELPIDSYGEKKMCREVMKKHIVKLMAAGFYVCGRNKKVASGSKLRKFRVECDTEVEAMKNTHGIMAGFSLFDILHRSYHKLALRIKNRDENKFDDKMAAKFPLYAGMIKYRLEKAGQRRKLFHQVENTLYKIFSRYLPATFIHEIFFYFSNLELSKLVEIV
ncbi:Similar to FPV218: Putative ankyrin repeat protein FPV218 (Fowlpox virus (strain NVSL)) [Cotesia congregata]|uniref:Similar to FPV218: Putative ankyrin repeat protein FPV218 (Fowlpox virus (Strain NVSL)) n=1 Tax=Cotesia congregata TaxID=51543 RepID=A0A8J2MLN8_COTCN|nr:Similar to FPV218: Putative ankyrin repeat protein FPV218 (Fowlpox virus (strain NVSL)) [Cotesia congregata]